jgi:hypothetical protein
MERDRLDTLAARRTDEYLRRLRTKSASYTASYSLNPNLFILGICPFFTFQNIP